MTHNQPSGHRNKAPAKKKSFDAKSLSSEQREKIDSELKRRGWKSGGSPKKNKKGY